MQGGLVDEGKDIFADTLSLGCALLNSIGLAIGFGHVLTNLYKEKIFSNEEISF